MPIAVGNSLDFNNSARILNLPAPGSPNEPARLADLSSTGDTPVTYRMTENGATIPVTVVTDYFPANSSFPVEANSVYFFEFYLFYLKTVTTGNVIYSLVSTVAPANVVAGYQQTAAGGIASQIAPTTSAIVAGTALSINLVQTPGLTANANHHAIIRAMVETGVAAGNFRLRVQMTAGGITPLRGGFYRGHRLPSANPTETFVA
jgi:hypothetical protein